MATTPGRPSGAARPELVPDVPIELPREWGRYTLNSVLGSGGMGRVYGATLRGRGGFEKPVALKVLRPGLTAELLLEEARLGGLLHHPFIVETYDVGVLDDQVYLAMEWVKGPTLAQVLRTGEPIPIDVVVEIALQLSNALDHAHRARMAGRTVGLVHLDVKPQNVLLDPVGLTKLTDFGIARARGFRTQGGDRPGVGTRGYMAPEMLVDGDVDARADVFAVGTLLAELAMGRRLWPRRGWPAYIEAISATRTYLREEGLDEALDRALPGLGALVAHAVHTDPEHRLADMVALHTGLRALHPGGGSVAALVTRTSGDGTPPALEPRRSGSDPGTATAIVGRSNLGTAESLVGREAETLDLRRAIDRPGLATVTGPGGMGKTSLARSVGSTSTPAFSGGVWFVDLASALTIEDIVEAIRLALRITLQPGPAQARIEELAEVLKGRAATLLILDNFEQLVEFAGATVGHWLAAAPALTVLVTSQRRLGLPGERWVQLGGLHGAEGVALFWTRAEALGVTVPRTDEAIVAEIVAAVDGLPLAIELAAARVRVMPPKAIRSALGQGLGLLVDRSGQRTARHQTLERTIAWSWGLLAPWQQAALRQLAVFRSSFSVEEASGVLDLSAWPEAPWALFALEDLLDRSLVTLVPGDPPHFRLLTAVREFAETQLRASGEAADTIARHGRLQVPYGRKVQILARHGPDARAALDDLLRHAADIRWALDHAVARGDVHVAYHTCRAWCDVQDAVGTPQAQIDDLEAVLRLEDLGDRYRLAVLHQLCVTCEALGLYNRRDELLRRGLALAHELGDWLWIGIIEAGLNAGPQRAGDFRQAQLHLRRALDAAQRANDTLNETIYRINLSLCIRGEGRLEEALAMMRGTLHLAESRGQRPLQGHLVHHIGTTHFRFGHFEEARTFCARGLEDNVRTHLGRFAVEAHVVLAELADDPDEVRSHQMNALAIAGRHADQRVISRTLATIALQALDDPARALDLAMQGVRCTAAAGLRQRLAGVAYAAALHADGRTSEAVAQAQRTIAELEIQPCDEQALALLWSARIRAAAGDRKVALARRARAVELLQFMGLGPGAPLHTLLLALDDELAG